MGVSNGMGKIDGSNIGTKFHGIEENIHEKHDIHRYNK
jgi:hypothetical protein